MNKITARLWLLLCLLPAISVAHHNYRAVYDFSKHETIEGVFVRLELVNPHMRIFLDVTNQAGETEQWIIEGPGKLALARRGWTGDTFTAGERITATGNPAASGRNAIWIERLVRADGTEVLDPRVADALEIEEERRLRRAQRQESQPNSE